MTRHDTDTTDSDDARASFARTPVRRVFLAKAERLTRELKHDLEKVGQDLEKVGHELKHLVHELPFNLRFRAVLLATIVHGVVYSAANHWPSRTPRLLTMTAFDQAVPFLPFTVFPYVSAYPFVFVAFLSLRRQSSQVRFLEVFISCVVVAGFIHWAMPTSYPRELYPLLETHDWPSRTMLSIVRQFDTPSSCLPSLHVATAVCSALLVRRERPRLFFAYLAWALGIIVSTLTTKQHYLVDVISGAALALATTVLVDVVNGRRRAPRTHEAR